MCFPPSPCSLCPYCLTDPGLSSFFPPQRSGSGAGALRETAAVQSEEVQFFPLRLGSVRQTGSARRDRTDSFCGLCGEGESKRRFLEMPRKMIFFPPFKFTELRETHTRQKSSDLNGGSQKCFYTQTIKYKIHISEYYYYYCLWLYYKIEMS